MKRSSRVGAYLPVIEVPGRDLQWQLTEGIFVLSARSARLFGADCAEHVLTIWEAQFPNDPTPKLAVEAARKAARANAPKRENILPNANEPMSEAGQRAIDAWEAWTRFDYGVGCVARAAANACSLPAGQFWTHSSPKWEQFSAQAAKSAAQEAWGYSQGFTMATLPVQNPEAEWQYERLKEYLQLDAQDAMLRDQGQDVPPLEGDPQYKAFGTLVRRQTLEMLALLQKRKVLSEKHQRLIVDCANEISERYDAEFWALARQARQVLSDKLPSALHVLIAESWMLNPEKILKDWGPFKPSPKRPKKETKVGGEEPTIAALYVHKGGVYYGLPNVDPWDESRDARRYPGPFPVLCHSPCERWGRYWGGEPSVKVPRTLGDDQGCFAAALAAVRQWGGVLEHPEATHAWAAFGLHRPPRAGGWVPAGDNLGFVCQVEQGHYGHRARKATWLYAVDTDRPELIWGPSTGERLDEGFHSTEERRAARERGVKPRKRLSQQENIDTPLAFRDLLISLARSAVRNRAYQVRGTLVGAKPKWNDPSQKPEDLARITKSNPKAYTNPNLSFESLMKGAMLYPWLVEQNPFLPMLQLEDPVRYQRLDLELTEGWRENGANLLSEVNQRLYAADCAERVLPILEKKYPMKRTAYFSIEVAREYAHGRITDDPETQLDDVHTAAASWATTIKKIRGDGATEKAANAAASASHPVAASAANLAPTWAILAIRNYPAASSGDTWDKPTNVSKGDYIAEMHWQADRVRHYYTMQHPEYHPPVRGIVGGQGDWANPSLLVKMAKKNPRAYADPDMPLRVLIEAAKTHPWYVSQNPALSAKWTEDPALYEQIEMALIAAWRGDVVEALSAKSQRLYAADCAEHALHFYEEKYPNDPRLREAIRVARRYAEGHASKAELQEACAATYKARPSFAMQAAYYSTFPSAQDAAFFGSGAAVMAPVRQTGDFAKEAEASWQAARVRHYYMMEHPEHQLPQKISGKRPVKKASRSRLRNGQ